MTLAEKREVITVLLCGWRGGCSNVGCRIGASRRAQRRAVKRRAALLSGRSRETHEQWELAALEAAYRLIESSPQLRAEWFGGES